MEYIKSPLNYTGGKFKLLPQIIPLFPSNINTFVDLFGGGFNVGVNVQANKIIYNDSLIQVSKMLQYFYDNNTEEIIKGIEFIVEHFNLSKTNKEGYLKLREEYNLPFPQKDFIESLMLYVLICHSFNNQIRFNSHGEFNLPFGLNRNFNPILKAKLIVFLDQLHNKNVKFTSKSFEKLKPEKLTLLDFVYLDPPYFNTTATYNENKGWDEQAENKLRELCQKLNEHNIRFALSNNLSKNISLENWAVNMGFNIHILEANYSNCNYQKKDKNKKDKEVLITNY